MPWPTGGVDTTQLDQGSDNPSLARTALLAMAQQINDLSSMLGAALGAASLDATGKLPTAQLPTGLIPSGVFVPFAGGTAPSGWLLCDGSVVSRTTYSTLFAAIGATFGAGDGSTTFGLPDLRGRVVAGRDDMGGTAASRLTVGGSGIAATSLGATGGAETHTLTSAQIPAHTHPIPGTSVSAVGAGAGNGVFNNSGSGLATSANTGGGGAHNNTQPTLVGNYIIKT